MQKQEKTSNEDHSDKSSLETSKTDKTHKKNTKKSNNIGLILPIMLIVLVVLVVEVMYYHMDRDDNDTISNDVGLNNTIDIERHGQEIIIYKYTMPEEDEEPFYSVFYGPAGLEDQSRNSEEIGKVTCITNDCELISTFKQYAVVGDNGTYYVFDYEDDKLVAGPLGKANADYSNIQNVSHLNDLYAVVVQASSTMDIYYIRDNKIYNDIAGEYISDTLLNNYSAFAKYGLLVINVSDEKKNNFFNMRNGDVVYSFEADYDIEPLECDSNIYIVLNVGKKENSTKLVYNQDGKQVFNGEKFENIMYSDDRFIAIQDNKVKIYDESRNLIKESKEYSDVLMTGKDFAVVVDENKLQLVDLEDNLLTTFIDNYSDDRYYLHAILSGWHNDNDKNGIYLVIQDNQATASSILKENPELTADQLIGMGLGYEYYYIPKTKETGRIATYIGGYAKPVLYLYPEKDMEVSVDFEHKNYLTTTYPKFVDKWQLIARTNGDLMDASGRHYYALYWEENINHDISFQEGFYVESKDATNFLENALKQLGFNERESNEFIMYWLPILERNKKSLVYFELTEERESSNKLIIEPQPDSLLRVAIHIKKVNEQVNIQRQVLPTFKRQGFTAVEWGGVIH